jgi:hypothetical protein
VAIRKFSASSLTNPNSKSSKLWDQETTLGTFESIAMATSSGSDTTITFSNIPQNYAHLQVRGLFRSDKSADTNADLYLYLNGDTSMANYTRHYLRGNGATASSLGWSSGDNRPVAGEAPAASSTANVFGASIIDILDYANTTKYTNVRTLHGDDQNSGTSASNVYLTSSLWLNTNAVTSLTFMLQATTNFIQYSTFALYGIRGA